MLQGCDLDDGSHLHCLVRSLSAGVLMQFIPSALSGAPSWWSWPWHCLAPPVAPSSLPCPQLKQRHAAMASLKNNGRATMVHYLIQQWSQVGVHRPRPTTNHQPDLRSGGIKSSLTGGINSQNCGILSRYIGINNLKCGKETLPFPPPDQL